MIRRLREEKGLTQSALAEKLTVSDKAVSKWETGKGYPDITLIEPLCAALGVSVTELLAGDTVTNNNRSFNMKRCVFYVCPVCGNVIVGTGEAVVNCHGITLMPLEAEKPDEAHAPSIEAIEDEYYVTFAHEMTKSHYLSFLAAVTDNGITLTKFYPEGNAETRVAFRRLHTLYWYCNRDGLFGERIQINK